MFAAEVALGNLSCVGGVQLTDLPSVRAELVDALGFQGQFQYGSFKSYHSVRPELVEGS